MLKLRILLLRNYIYYIILFIAIIYFLITTVFLTYKTNYKDFKNKQFTIIKIEEKDYGVRLTLKNHEKVLGIYYLEEKEKIKFLKEYSLGDKIIINGIKNKLTNNTIENNFNYKKYLYYNKIYNLIEITKLTKIQNNKNIFYKLKDYLYKRSNKLSKTHPYIKSLLLGDNNYINIDIKETYKNNGISHLFAISGLHISLFSSILLYILKKLKLKENTRYIIVIMFLLLYMFITGFTPSVIRASIFTILIIINKIKYFYIKEINILLLSLSITIFINPFILYNIGYQFSFINTFFLIISSNKINKQKNFIKKLLTTSLISNLSSFPISINNFYETNFMSIIFNIFFVPFLSNIVMPLTIISFIFPSFDKILYIFINIMEKTSILFNKIKIFKIIFCKMSIIHIIIYYMILILLIKISKKRYLVILILTFILHYNSPLKNEDYIIFFDVEQGDSSLIVIDGKTTLIDTGGKPSYDKKEEFNYSKNKILPYLKSKGIRKIDNLILTHGDYDHMGEAINIVKNFKVNNVIFNKGNYNYLEKRLIKVINDKNIKYYKGIKELKLDNINLYFLNTDLYDNENDDSNVLYFKYKNTKFLFMGDAGINKEKAILEKYNLKDIDFLKVGHHGSDTSSGDEFIEKISPKNSIISVGKNNKYGHPKNTVLEILKDSNIYRTDKDGSIKIKLNKNGYGYKIITYKP